MKQWAYLYKQCQSCYSADKPHKGHGLCTTCYYRQYQRPNPPIRRTKPQSTTQDQLDEAYQFGLDEGRTQVANAVHEALESHGLRCSLTNNFLYLHIPTGKTYEINLDNQL